MLYPIVKKTIPFFVNSNIYISIAAVLFTIQGQIQLGQEPHYEHYLTFVFFATLFEYNIHKLISIHYNKNLLKEVKYSWNNQYRVSFYIICLISLLGLISSLFLLSKKDWDIVFLVGSITLFYSIPIYKKGSKLWRLREIPYLKSVFIAFVWSIVSSLFPCKSFSANALKDVLGVSIEHFLFIFAIAIPFDIKDLKQDRQENLKTIPIFLGPKKSRQITAFLLFLHMITVVLYNNNNIITPLIFSSLITLACIHSKKVQQFPYYHYGILDGMIVLQFLLVFFSV